MEPKTSSSAKLTVNYDTLTLPVYLAQYDVLLLLLVGVGVTFALLNEISTPPPKNKNREPSSSVVEGGSPDGGGEDDDLWKKIALALAALAATAGFLTLTSWGLSGDWLLFYREPTKYSVLLLDWTFHGLRQITDPTAMASFLDGIWSGVWSEATSVDGILEAIKFIDVPDRMMGEMYREILSIDKNYVIKLVLQAYPKGATEQELQDALTKALTYEIQAIAVTYVPEW